MSRGLVGPQGTAELAAILSRIIMAEAEHRDPAETVVAIAAICLRSMEDLPADDQATTWTLALQVCGLSAEGHESDPDVARVRAESPSWQRAAAALDAERIGVSP